MNYKWIIRKPGNYFNGGYSGHPWCHELCRAVRYDSPEDAKVALLGNAEYLDNVEIIPFAVTFTSDDVVRAFIGDVSKKIKQLVALASYWNHVAVLTTLTDEQKNQIKAAPSLLDDQLKEAEIIWMKIL